MVVAFEFPSLVQARTAFQHMTRIVASSRAQFALYLAEDEQRTPYVVAIATSSAPGYVMGLIRSKAGSALEVIPPASFNRMINRGQLRLEQAGSIKGHYLRGKRLQHVEAE